MSEPLIELHVPFVLVQNVPEGGYAYPCLEAIESHLFALDGQGRGEMYDDGEEHEGEYLFFLASAPEVVLLESAGDLRALPGVPEETYALVPTTDAVEWGVGRRVDIAA